MEGTTSVPHTNFTPLSPASVAAEVLPDPHTPTNNKSRLLRILPFVAFATALGYMLRTVVTEGVVLILSASLAGNGLAPVSIFKLFPGFIEALILYAVASLCLLFVAFELRLQTKKGFIIGCIVFIFTLLIPPFVVPALLAPITRLASLGLENIPAVPYTIPLADPFYLANIAGLFMLITARRSFGNSKRSLSGKAKLFLLLMVVAVVVPIVFIFLTDYATAQKTDYGYGEVTAIAGYHVYKPLLLPSNLAYAMNFKTGKELAGKNNAVWVAFDTPLNLQLEGKKGRPVTVTQVGVEKDFNIDTYAPVHDGKTMPQQVPLDNALNRNAYLYMKEPHSSSMRLNTLLFLTKDMVLISVTSLGASGEELINFASSLK